MNSGSYAVLITGGAGFIGSAIVRELLARGVERVVVLDALTYAGGRDNLPASPQVELVEGRIEDAALVDHLMATVRLQSVLHLAAESHVDRSDEALSR